VEERGGVGCGEEGAAESLGAVVDSTFLLNYEMNAMKQGYHNVCLRKVSSRDLSWLSYPVFLHASTSSAPPATMPDAPTPQSLSSPP